MPAKPRNEGPDPAIKSAAQADHPPGLGENRGPDPYRLILQELRRKRQEIDQAIAAIEQVASSAQTASVEPACLPSAASQPISVALLSAMRELGGSATNADIKAVLRRSGYRFRGDPTVSVAQCLVRLAKSGVVSKLDRGVWKLRPGAEKLRL